ncbi:MAG: hypothetical protein QOE69_1687 [Thermoleophilaceae bacterium]|nr:hypothetical protein [Thermoleophilaceae bacterium]
MADRDVIDRAGKLLGVAVCTLPARRERWSTTYGVRLRGARAVQLMRQLRPLMGERRRLQIDRAIASYAPDPRRLLNETRAARALSMLARGSSVRDVAEQLGTSIWCIYDLRLGRTHAQLPRPG